MNRNVDDRLISKEGRTMFFDGDVGKKNFVTKMNHSVVLSIIRKHFCINEEEFRGKNQQRLDVLEL